MGQFLCIGIRTALKIERKELEQPFLTPENVQAEVERLLVPLHLYEKIEKDDYLLYLLKDEAIKDEFIPFLKEFYRIRYDEIGDTFRKGDSFINKISEYNNLREWIGLAEKKMMECFQISQDYASLRLDNKLYASYLEETIILSLTGKVWMECYGSLFAFLLNCIKLRLSDFKMKDTLSINITD